MDVKQYKGKKCLWGSVDSLIYVSEFDNIFMFQNVHNEAKPIIKDFKHNYKYGWALTHTQFKRELEEKIIKILENNKYELWTY